MILLVCTQVLFLSHALFYLSLFFCFSNICIIHILPLWPWCFFKLYAVLETHYIQYGWCEARITWSYSLLLFIYFLSEILFFCVHLRPSKGLFYFSLGWLELPLFSFILYIIFFFNGLFSFVVVQYTLKKSSSSLCFFKLNTNILQRRIEKSPGWCNISKGNRKRSEQIEK